MGLTKLCIHCNIHKLLTEMKKDKAMAQGRSSTCHDCYRLKYRKPKAIEEPIVDLEGERWKLVEELDCKYKISNFGRLISLDYNREGRQKIMVLPLSRGYHRIAVSVNNVKINIPIHRLVAKYFIPNPENKPQVNHIDGIRNHNWEGNLEWATASENISHAFRTGLASNVGERHSRTNMTDTTAREIKILIGKGYTNKTISQRFSISPEVVSAIRNGKRWTHITI